MRSTSVESKALPELSPEEHALCKAAFRQFDSDGSGAISVKELKSAMIAMGQNPSDDEVFHLVALVDQDGSKEIEYEEFIYAFRISKSMQLHPDEQDTVDAWLALGGNHDQSGSVRVEKLIALLDDFGLRVNVDCLGLGGDTPKEELLYAEFKSLLQ